MTVNPSLIILLWRHWLYKRRGRSGSVRPLKQHKVGNVGGLLTVGESLLPDFHRIPLFGVGDVVVIRWPQDFVVNVQLVSQIDARIDLSV